MILKSKLDFPAIELKLKQILIRPRYSEANEQQIKNAWFKSPYAVVDDTLRVVELVVLVEVVGVVVGALDMPSMRLDSKVSPIRAASRCRKSVHPLRGDGVEL